MSQSLRRVSRAAAVVRLGATVLVVVFAATCVRDQPTAPALLHDVIPNYFQGVLRDTTLHFLHELYNTCMNSQ